MTWNRSCRLQFEFATWALLASVLVCPGSWFPLVAAAEEMPDAKSLHVIMDKMDAIIADTGEGYASFNDRTSVKDGLVIATSSSADEILEELARLPAAERKLVRRIHLKDPAQSITTAKTLSKFPQLEYLSVDGNRGAWKHEWCEHLVDLPLKTLRLQALDLSGGLESIGKIESLEVLYLDGNSFPAGSVADLQKLDKLRQLDLSGSPINDEDVAVIEGFTQLFSLGLSDTLISNRGLVHLQTCKKLKYLTLVGTKVTEKGIDELRQHVDGVIASYGER